VFHISIWGLGALFGWANPTKAPRGDWTATCSTGNDLHCWKATAKIL